MRWGAAAVNEPGGHACNDYVFERSLDYRHPDGSITKLYVDCYKRGCFVLEAKQSARRQADDERKASLFGSEANSRKLGQAKRGSRGWDRVMRAAYTQAVDYTRQLPVEHGYPTRPHRRPAPLCYGRA